MEQSVLDEFYARYPSALGSSRAGGFLRIICLNCGNLVSLPEPEATQTSIDIHCPACGWEEHIGPKSEAA